MEDSAAREQVERWATWALSQADELDPITNGTLSPLLGFTANWKWRPKRRGALQSGQQINLV